MIYSIFEIGKISTELSGAIKVEQEIDGAWIDVTRRCKFVHADERGVALFVDLDSTGHPYLEKGRHRVSESWITGNFRVSIPDDAAPSIRDEYFAIRIA